MLHEAALKVLRVIAGLMPGQCALMSALYSLALEKLGSQRGYVVAGSLCIGDKRVISEDKGFDGKETFSESNLDWDGHAWVVYGDWLDAQQRIGESIKSHYTQTNGPGRGR